MTEFFSQGAADLTDDARSLLSEIDRAVPGAASVTADCRPPLDVLETATSLEVIVDIPGVAAEALRIAIRRDTLLIVGAKLGPTPDAGTRFHLAERSYGRFARAVRLQGAFDAGGARAIATAGQVRVILPLLPDRRGRVFNIAVERV